MRSARLRSALVLLFALALPSAPAFASGSGRLLRDVLPTAERLKLNLDARKKGYSGSASIDLSVKAATDSFQFHSEGLRLTRVTLRKTRAVVPSTHVQVATNVVTLRTRTPLKPGAYVMDIDFTNDFGTQAQGIYRLDTEGESYCFTQFESDDARKAFPCWDEPSFKIPYTITLTVPKTHRAVGLRNGERDRVRDLERGLVPARESLARVIRLELGEAVGFALGIQPVDPLRLGTEIVREVDVHHVSAGLQRRPRPERDHVGGYLYMRRGDDGPRFPQRHPGQAQSLRVELEAVGRGLHAEIDRSRAGVALLASVQVQLQPLRRREDVAKEAARAGSEGRGRGKGQGEEQDERGSESCGPHGTS